MRARGLLNGFRHRSFGGHLVPSLQRTTQSGVAVAINAAGLTPEDFASITPEQVGQPQHSISRVS